MLCETENFRFFDRANFGLGVLSMPPKRISLKEDKQTGVIILSITLERLQAMKNSTNEPINKESLVDIRDVRINQELPVTDRILQFIALTKNPYLYKYGDKVVRINFAETEVTFEERMKGYFEML